MSPAQSTERHQIIIALDLIRRIENWRRKQPDLPNKSEAIRRLVEVGLGITDGVERDGEKKP